MSTVLNVSATTFVNQPVTVSLSGITREGSTIEIQSGDATAFGQNVTYIPPSDFTGTAVVNCESDGNKIVIAVNVIQKPKGFKDEEKKVRRQVRETTMAGEPVEERHWKIVEDSGKIEGPSAAYVPLRIAKVDSLNVIENYEPEKAIDGLKDTYFSAIGVGSWLQLDLGQACNVSEIFITWNDVHRQRQTFTLAISQDRKNYQNVYQGRGMGVNDIHMPNKAIVLIKITAMDDTLDITDVTIKGAPITPRATATGAQAVLIHSSQIVEPGQLVTMDGSLSKGDVIKYVWDQSAGLPAVQLFNSDTNVCSFIAPDVEAPTTLQISLTAVDRNGQYSKAESLIHIKPAPRIAGDDYTIPKPFEATPEEMKLLGRVNNDFKKERKKSSS